MSNIQEILQSLQGATVFSSLDASGAYYAAFIRPFGTFQYIRRDFGLANAGSVYTRMLDVAMKDEDRDFL